MKPSIKKIIAIASIAMCCFKVNASSIFSFSETATNGVETAVVFVKDPKALEGKAAQLDEISAGQLSALLQHNDFGGELGSELHLQMVADFKDILVVGIQTELPLDAPKLQNLGGRIADALDATKMNVMASIFVEGLDAANNGAAAQIAYGYELRNYHFDKYKSEKDEVESNIVLVTESAQFSQSLFTNDLQYLADGVHMTRDLASEPGKSLYPEVFVERVSTMFRGINNIDIEVLDLKDMEKFNMGALMGVGKGSIHEPRMLVIKYTGGEKGDAPIALAGKGITFDTGGISIKSNTNMWQMKSDMAGAAAVAGTMYAISKRAENVNVVGLMPLAENMPAKDAIRPGDVLNTMEGTTIEIISTDAEGRLVLSDAVYYAQQTFEPKILLNIATLTGSAARALSDEYAAVITRDFSLSQQMMQVGEKSGELVWPLPLHPNHYKQITSDIADIKNSGAGNPGASIGAAVVGTFIDEKLPWVHLDIAGVDWLSSSIDVAPSGSQGWGVRFMDQFVRDNK